MGARWGWRPHGTMALGCAIVSTVSVTSFRMDFAHAPLCTNEKVSQANGVLAGSSAQETLSASIASPQPLKLLQAHVFFRHGDRSPIPLGSPTPEEAAKWEARVQPRPHCLPPRQHARGLEYPYGQLTRKGAAQARELGQALRSRYHPLLLLPRAMEDGTDQTRTPSYSHEHLSSTLSVRSTDFPRTFLTAFFVLQGLLDSESAAADVDIQVRAEDEENLYENDSCARGALLWKKAWKHLSSPPSATGQEGQQAQAGWRKEFQHLRDILEKHFKLEPKTSNDSSSSKFPWVTAIDNVECGMCHGDPLPIGVTPLDVGRVRYRLSKDYARVFSHQEIAQLAMGPLIHEVLSSMQAAMDAPASSSSSSPSPRLLLYSGHDASLMPLAAALGRPFPTWPPYASSLSLELWATADGQQHFVRVLYNHQETGLPNGVPPAGASWQDLGLMDDSTCCVLLPWDHFLRVANWTRMSPDEHADACRIKSHM